MTFGVFSIPRQALGTKITWVIIYTLMLFLNKYIELDSWVIRHTYMAFLEKYKVLSLLLYTRIKILKVIFCNKTIYFNHTNHNSSTEDTNIK